MCHLCGLSVSNLISLETRGNVFKTFHAASAGDVRSMVLLSYRVCFLRKGGSRMKRGPIYINRRVALVCVRIQKDKVTNR